MQKRLRGSEEILNDSIEMALKKADEGCLNCAEGYFTLAKKNGATEEILERAIERHTNSKVGKLSRRDLLKLASLGAAALTASSIGLKTANAYSYYWGTDGLSPSSQGIPQNFYIGQTGFGAPYSYSGNGAVTTTYFNNSAASQAGSQRTYLYWGVKGPASKPGSLNAYNWGVAQGNDAVNSWFAHPSSPYIYGRTIFGDIEETAFPGWAASSQTDNRLTFQGFIDAIATSTRYNYQPGIYISPYNWSQFYGTSFRPTRYFVLWTTGCRTCTISCHPTFSCNTMTDVQNNVVPTTANVVLGGSQMVISQYYTTDCPDNANADWDVSIQNPYDTFFPYTSGSSYQAAGC